MMNKYLNKQMSAICMACLAIIFIVISFFYTCLSNNDFSNGFLLLACLMIFLSVKGFKNDNITIPILIAIIF